MRRLCLTGGAWAFVYGRGRTAAACRPQAAGRLSEGSSGLEGCRPGALQASERRLCAPSGGIVWRWTVEEVAACSGVPCAAFQPITVSVSLLTAAFPARRAERRRCPPVVRTAVRHAISGQCMRSPVLTAATITVLLAGGGVLAWLPGLPRSCTSTTMTACASPPLAPGVLHARVRGVAR